jgi:hypothetical protein
VSDHALVIVAGDSSQRVFSFTDADFPLLMPTRRGQLYERPVLRAMLLRADVRTTSTLFV